MFLERYRKTNDIEKFLNIRGNKLVKALFGELFELYVTEKIIEMKDKTKPFKISLGNIYRNSNRL